MKNMSNNLLFFLLCLLQTNLKNVNCVKQKYFLKRKVYVCSNVTAQFFFFLHKLVCQKYTDIIMRAMLQFIPQMSI